MYLNLYLFMKNIIKYINLPWKLLLLYLWDTNIDGKPVLILKQINGKTTMFQPKLYKAFLDKQHRYN